MPLDEEYPKTFRKQMPRLRQVLDCDSQLSPAEREEIAASLDSMADLATDLNDIVQRLLQDPHTPAEIGELLIAFELTTEQLRGHSDVIDGKLYEIGDRLKRTTPASLEER
jgi:hypothetical protein